MNGTKEISIGGKLRPTKFGTNQTAKYCDIRNVSLMESQNELKDIKSGNGTTMRDLIYSALWAGCKTEKIDIDFDEYNVGDWMDDIEPDELVKIFTSLANSNDSGEVKGEAKEADEKKS